MTNTINDVPVQKLANLDQRLERWEAENTQLKQSRKEALKLFLTCWFGYAVLFIPATYVFGESHHLVLVGKILSTAFLLSIPFAIYHFNICNRPRLRPTQQDVETDIALRKAFNMDSEVKQ